MSLDTATREHIESLLKSHRVVLFMKGNRSQPACGFSAAARAQLPALPQARILEDEGYEALAALPKDTELAFICQRGISSQGVAERFAAHGFSHVHNVAGGMEAWHSA